MFHPDLTPVSSLPDGSMSLGSFRLTVSPSVDVGNGKQDQHGAWIIFGAYYKLISTVFSQKSYDFQPKGLSTQH